MKNVLTKKNIMVLGTSSGAGKSLITTAICRSLLKRGEQPIPFKGQNMSNNAWVDLNGGEMAYSQAVQAWAAGLEPICLMNPILLKPQGDSKSEIIHCGKSVGITSARNYYKDWFDPGWNAIKQSIDDLRAKFKNSRLVLEGAGSPVEMNLKYRDLTNLRLAKYLQANCILVTDIERGGVFAQLIGTLQLLTPVERKLIKGIIINRFRGDLSLFNEGKDWIERNTKVPVLGIMPSLEDIFPPEDSLDLLNRELKKKDADLDIVVLRLPSISNFSDLEPLEGEQTINLRWTKPGQDIGFPDAVIIPGSKQTMKDLFELRESGSAEIVKNYVNKGGCIFGICGGLQILGESLYDPENLEQESHCSSHTEEGLGLIPIKTIFKTKKSLTRRKVESLWPNKEITYGFEVHHGFSFKSNNFNSEIEPIFKDQSLGWVIYREGKGTIAGTYLHGIFENGSWRRSWLNELRRIKNLNPLSTKVKNYSEKREELIERLNNSFDKHINLDKVL